MGGRSRFPRAQAPVLMKGARTWLFVFVFPRRLPWLNICASASMRFPFCLPSFALFPSVKISMFLPQIFLPRSAPLFPAVKNLIFSPPSFCQKYFASFLRLLRLFAATN